MAAANHDHIWRYRPRSSLRIESSQRRVTGKKADVGRILLDVSGGGADNVRTQAATLISRIGGDTTQSGYPKRFMSVLNLFVYDRRTTHDAVIGYEIE